MAENANVEEAVMASSSPVPPIANEPARGEHTRAQPTALANLKSNSVTYAEAVMSSVPDVKQRTRTNDYGGDHPANAASSSATAGTEPAIMMSDTNSLTTQKPPPYKPPPTPPPPPPNAKTRGSSVLCCWPPPPPPTH